MKKFLYFILTFCLVIFCGCDDQINNIVIDNISDLRTNFFVGENETFFAELSSGKREEQFFYDGISTQKVDCAVLSIGFFKTNYSNAIEVQVEIDGQKQNAILQHSPFEELFMVDLEKTIDDNAKISVVYNDKKVDLKCFSKDWQIDYIKALNLGIKNFQAELENLYFNGKLNAEGYLKIVYEREFGKTYWYFGIIDRSGKRYSILIDVNSGLIIDN